jgi:RNA polymerase-binding transcription factor DksA
MKINRCAARVRQNATAKTKSRRLISVNVAALTSPTLKRGGHSMHYHYFTLEQRNALENAIRSRLAEPGMKDALERLHTPQFGVCESCGADIAYIKLAGNPRLTRCSGCATNR